MTAAEIARLKEIAGKAFIVSFHDEGGAYLGDISAKSILSLLTALEQSQAALAEAQEALKPFGDIDGGEDEEYPDGTEAVIKFGRSHRYGVTLGDFRRARAAIAEMEGK